MMPPSEPTAYPRKRADRSRLTRSSKYNTTMTATMSAAQHSYNAS